MPPHGRNVELVLRWFEHVGSRFENPGASYELLDPEVIIDASRMPNPDAAGVFRGHDGVREFWRRFLAAWEDWEFRPEDVVEHGERVVLTMYMRGVGKSSGIEVENRHAQVWAFEGDRVVRCDFYPDRAAASDAL